MSGLPPDVRASLQRRGGGLHVLVCVGNPLRRDDGVGPFIASRLLPGPGRVVLDAGPNPERLIGGGLPDGPAAELTVIDAADFGGRPGEVRIVPPEWIPETSCSTHALSLRVICRLLAEDAGRPVTFIGIQPASVSLGEGLSPAVQDAAEAIIACLNAPPSDGGREK